MIKKFEEYVTENINYGFGKIKFDDKESESRYKEIKKEKEKKEFEKLKKYEKYFGELDDNDVKKINKEDLKDVLNNILKYLKTFKTPLERFIKDDDKIGDAQADDGIDAMLLFAGYQEIIDDKLRDVGFDEFREIDEQDAEHTQEHLTLVWQHEARQTFQIGFLTVHRPASLSPAAYGRFPRKVPGRP